MWHFGISIIVSDPIKSVIEPVRTSSSAFTFHSAPTLDSSSTLSFARSDVIVSLSGAFSAA